MSRSTPGTPLRRSAWSLAVALLAGAAVLSGCSATTTSREGADTTRGKELFVESCGSCHVLADAGTQGEVGPNLDDGFGYTRRQGFEESTIFEVVNEQMEIPGPPMPDFDEPGTKEYLSDESRVAIAAYVAACAGVIDGKKVSEQCTGGTGIDQGETDPKAVFVGAGCGACHTLADAGTTGQVGPSLDDLNIALEAAIEQITNGGGGMPAYEGKLTEEQIRLLAQYVTGRR